MSERYQAMPPLAGGHPAGVQGAAPHAATADVPAFLRRVDRGSRDRSSDLVSGPTPVRAPLAALLEEADQVIGQLSASTLPRLDKIIGEILGPIPIDPVEACHVPLAFEEGLVVAAVRKLELIRALVDGVEQRIRAFEHL